MVDRLNLLLILSIGVWISVLVAVLVAIFLTQHHGIHFILFLVIGLECRSSLFVSQDTVHVHKYYD